MPENLSNKAFTILPASIIASLVCAIALSTYRCLLSEGGFANFASCTYFAFINDLLMPVAIASTLHYISLINSKNHGILEQAKKILLLSMYVFLLVFGWNALELVINYHKIPNDVIFMNRIINKLLLGIITALPIALIVSSTFFLFGKEQGKAR